MSSPCLPEVEACWLNAVAAGAKRMPPFQMASLCLSLVSPQDSQLAQVYQGLVSPEEDSLEVPLGLVPCSKDLAASDTAALQAVADALSRVLLVARVMAQVRAL